MRSAATFRAKWSVLGWSLRNIVIYWNNGVFLMSKLRIAILAAVLLGTALCFQLIGDQPNTGADGPQFTASGQLLRPSGYRTWVWLSSGLGMAYGPNAPQSTDDPPFDNVFVGPSAYAAFQKNGVWPDGTVMVLEIRSSLSKGSINRGGHFQGPLRAVEAEVKQKGKWAFYGFEAEAASAARIPETASCYSCHAANGAVDNTFVQFYPTLIDVARAKGTFRQATGQ
jgi:hypothetical protein